MALLLRYFYRLNLFTSALLASAQRSFRWYFYCAHFSSLDFPPWTFDAHATMAALEHLEDTARENADANILRYNAILRQTRGLAENPVLQRVRLKLLGSKEEIAIAKAFDKATRSYPPTPPPPPRCGVVFNQVPNTALQEPSHAAFRVAMLMALFVLHAAVLGRSPEIVELKKDVIVQLFRLF